MTNLLRAILPGWARPDHPVLAYELARLQGDGRSRTRFLRLLTAGLLLGVAGYLDASIGQPASFSDWLWRGLYLPMVCVQAVCVLAALGIGIASVDAERGRRAWDHRRVTEGGAILTLRLRWLAALYRLRAPLLAILLARLALVLLMLYDLAAFGGGYGGIIAGGAVSPWLGALLIALAIALVLLLPLAAVGVAAALGILISVVIKRRIFALMLQCALSAVWLAVVAAGALVANMLLLGGGVADDRRGFPLVLSYCAIVDWGLLLANLAGIADLWRMLTPGVWLSAALAVALLLMASACDGLLSLAGWLAERGE